MENDDLTISPSFSYDRKEVVIPPLCDSDCVAHFSPRSNWDGSNFGFDWIRIGDSQMKADKDPVMHHYAYLMGRYWGLAEHEVTIGEAKLKINKVKIGDDENRWDKTKIGNPTEFRRDVKLYDRLISNSFPIQFKIPWKEGSKITCPSTIPDEIKDKINESQSLYFVPIMTLKREMSAQLQLLVEVNPDMKKNPIRIIVEEQNQEEPKFTISGNPFPVSDGMYDLSITCNELFSDVQFIDAFAIYTNELGQEVKKRCGQLRVLANDMRREMKIVFVKVDLQVGRRWKRARFDNPDISGLKEILNQAMIDVNENITDNIITIELDNSDIYNKRIVNLLKNGKLPSDKRNRVVGNISAALNRYLDRDVNNKLSPKLQNYLKVCVVNLDCVVGTDSEGEGEGEGEALNSGVTFVKDKFILLFNGRGKGTMVHEVLHGMELYHSYTAKDVNEREKAAFTYEAMKTDNIMDYSHNAVPPIERVSTWYWQWEYLWDYINFLEKKEKERILSEAKEKMTKMIIPSTK